MSSQKTGSIFTTLYANRITVAKDSQPIVNLSLLFCLIALLTAPWLVIGGAIAAVALGYRFRFVRNAEGFSRSFDTVVREAKENVRSVVDAVTTPDEPQS